MGVAKFEVGERVTYYPVKKNELDNRHWPAVVEEVLPRGRLRVKIETESGIKSRSVTPRRLARQNELL